MRHSIRFRLLALLLACIIILTAINISIAGWGILRIRDRTIVDNTQALEQQAATYLQNLAQDRATATVEMLRVAQHTAVVTRDYLSQARTINQVDTLLPFLPAPDGRRYYPGTTTIVLPSGADDQLMASARADGQMLDILLPVLARELPGIVRVSQLSSSGTLCTYPSLNLKNLPADWSVEQDPAYKVGHDTPRATVLWSEIHTALGDSGRVISAVAPVSQRSEFAGTIAVDVSLSYLTGYLKRIKVGQSGFAFLVDASGRLVAAPTEGQRELLGRVMSPNEQGTIVLEQALPSLGSVIAKMRGGGNAFASADIRGRTYIVAYAPISTLGWSLALAEPLDEITASTSATSERVTGIAHEAGQLGLIVVLAAVVLLGLGMSVVLRQQIIRPLTSLVGATKAIAVGDLQQITTSGAGEIGQLATAFNTMTASLATSRAEITAANLQLERKVQERTADLDLALRQIEESFATQQVLLRTLREVSTPVIPVVKGVLAMPLIGQIDEERVRNMTSALLARVERERAHTVLLDITGVPVLDTYVAQALLQLVAASSLLGAEVVLVGVSPEVAQTIVTLGIDLRGLRTAADLRSAVEKLLRADPARNGHMRQAA